MFYQYKEEFISFLKEVFEHSPTIVSDHYFSDAYSSEHQQTRVLKNIKERMEQLMSAKFLIGNDGYLSFTTLNKEPALAFDIDHDGAPMMGLPDCPKCGETHFAGKIVFSKKEIRIENSQKYGDGECSVSSDTIEGKIQIKVASSLVFTNFFSNGLKLNEPGNFHNINNFKGNLSFMEYHQRHNQLYIPGSSGTAKICVNKAHDEIIIVDRYQTNKDREDVPTGFRSRGTISMSVWSVVAKTAEDTSLIIPDKHESIVIDLVPGTYELTVPLVQKTAVFGKLKKIG